MSKARPRPIVFVCICIGENNVLISKVITAATQNDAALLFKEQTSFEPQEILGPFLKKKSQVIETTRVLKFSNQTKKAVYNDWLVNAFLLKEPVDHAYLVFIKRMDDKKVPLPKGTITAPISDLTFI